MKKKRFIWMLALALMVVFGITQQAAAISEDMSTADMIALVENFESEGQFANESAVRALKMHLTSVKHFEQQGESGKVVEHMNSFKQLLNHQLNGEQQTETVHGALTENTNAMIQIWGDVLALVSEGQALAAIVIDQEASTLEQQAASELVDYIQQISGVELPVVHDESDAAGISIYIGQAAPDYEDSLAAISAGGDQPDAFRLLVANHYISLNGLSDEGTLYAAYELLEQLGVRWFMPGELGIVIPSNENVAIDKQDTIQHPGYVNRFFQATERYNSNANLPDGIDVTEAAPWVKKMRLNQKYYGGHLFPCSIRNTDRPDLFLPNKNGDPTVFLDVTKPEVLDCIVEGALAELQKNPDLEVLNMAPRDGTMRIYNPDPEWDGDDMAPTYGVISATDRYIKFYNLVLERLEAAGYPDVKIAFYAYTTIHRPPVRWEPNPRLIPVIASIQVDRLHGIDNPLSWERSYLKDVIKGWQDVGLEPHMYQYIFNLADPNLPFSPVDQVSSEFKYYSDQGITSIRAEVSPSWGYRGPALYVAAKMMWNPNLDVEALLDDYFTKFYGPAAEPMREHFAILEEAVDNADYFAGSIYDFPNILTEDVMNELENSLITAEQIAEAAENQGEDPVYAERVNMIRIHFEYGNTFLKMMDSINRFDFVKAKEQYARIDDLRIEGVLHSPVIVNPAASYAYQRTFWKNQVDEGYQRVIDGNRIVAELPDEWNVMLFPNASGDEIGLWKPELGTESWMKLKTYSRTWSAQGLRYYKGHAWYRTTIDVDTAFDNGNPIHLWFSNVDESARVWMNGVELPILQQGSGLTKPWEFDATQAIKFGEPNVIVVDVRNESLDELGTGGIVGPVMLWEVVSEPDLIPPTAPADLMAQMAGDHTVNLSWSAATDNVGVVGYKVYRDDEEIGTTSETTFSDSNLEADTTYMYTVKAIDAKGNLSPASVQVQVNSTYGVFLFLEDFEDGNLNDWSLTAGRWSVVSDDGNNVLQHLGGPGANIATALAGDPAWTDYAVEVKIKPLELNTSSAITLYARYQNGSNNYRFRYVHSGGGRLEIVKQVAGQLIKLAETDYTFTPNTIYTFKAELDGHSLKFYMNDELAVQTEDDTFASGRINIQPSNSPMQVDDVLVTPVFAD